MAIINHVDSSVVQYTSQMSRYASVSHTHTQYLTTAALSNHTHVQYLNTSQSGNIYFQDGNGLSFGSSVSGMSTTITGSVNATGINVGNIYFVNSNGHTFDSSVNGLSTFYWVKTI